MWAVAVPTRFCALFLGLGWEWGAQKSLRATFSSIFSESIPRTKLFVRQVNTAWMVLGCPLAHMNSLMWGGGFLREEKGSGLLARSQPSQRCHFLGLQIIEKMYSR